MTKRYRYNEIEQVFSPERMRKYRMACSNDKHKAMTLYRYNLHIITEVLCYSEKNATFAVFIPGSL